MKSDCSSPEEKYIALSSWWERYEKIFSSWYLEATTNEQKDILLKASPDMPWKSPLTKTKTGHILQSTDMLLPELNLDAFLSNQGKILLLFLSRRLISTDLSFHGDILLLNGQFKRNMMPSFSNNNLINMDTPFVDPLDPDENIRSLGADVTNETRTQINAYLETGRLIHAEVFIALKLRRAALVSFIEILILECEKALSPASDDDDDDDNATTAGDSKSNNNKTVNKKLSNDNDEDIDNIDIDIDSIDITVSKTNDSNHHTVDTTNTNTTTSTSTTTNTTTATNNTTTDNPTTTTTTNNTTTTTNNNTTTDNPNPTTTTNNTTNNSHKMKTSFIPNYRQLLAAEMAQVAYISNTSITPNISSTTINNSSSETDAEEIVAVSSAIKADDEKVGSEQGSGMAASIMIATNDTSKPTNAVATSSSELEEVS